MPFELTRKTQRAAERIRELVSENPDTVGWAVLSDPQVGIRVGVKTKGCSGNEFALNLSKEKGKFDEEVDAYGEILSLAPLTLQA